MYCDVGKTDLKTILLKLESWADSREECGSESIAFGIRTLIAEYRERPKAEWLSTLVTCLLDDPDGGSVYVEHVGLLSVLRHFAGGWPARRVVQRWLLTEARRRTEDGRSASVGHFCLHGQTLWISRIQLARTIRAMEASGEGSWMMMPHDGSPWTGLMGKPLSLDRYVREMAKDLNRTSVSGWIRSRYLVPIEAFGFPVDAVAGWDQGGELLAAVRQLMTEAVAYGSVELPPAGPLLPWKGETQDLVHAWAEHRDYWGLARHFVDVRDHEALRIELLLADLSLPGRPWSAWLNARVAAIVDATSWPGVALWSPGDGTSLPVEIRRQGPRTDLQLHGLMPLLTQFGILPNDYAHPHRFTSYPLTAALAAGLSAVIPELWFRQERGRDGEPVVWVVWGVPPGPQALSAGEVFASIQQK